MRGRGPGSTRVGRRGSPSAVGRFWFEGIVDVSRSLAYQSNAGRCRGRAHAEPPAPHLEAETVPDRQGRGTVHSGQHLRGQRAVHPLPAHPAAPGRVGRVEEPAGRLGLALRQAAAEQRIERRTAAAQADRLRQQAAHRLARHPLDRARPVELVGGQGERQLDQPPVPVRPPHLEAVGGREGRLEVVAEGDPHVEEPRRLLGPADSLRARGLSPRHRPELLERERGEPGRRSLRPGADPEGAAERRAQSHPRAVRAARQGGLAGQAAGGREQAALRQQVPEPVRGAEVELVAALAGQDHPGAARRGRAVGALAQPAVHVGVRGLRAGGPPVGVRERPAVVAPDPGRPGAQGGDRRLHELALVRLRQLVEDPGEGVERSRPRAQLAGRQRRHRGRVEAAAHQHRRRLAGRAQATAHRLCQDLAEELRVVLVTAQGELGSPAGAPVAPQPGLAAVEVETQAVGRRQLAEVGEEGPARDARQQGEETRDRLRIERRRDRRLGEDGRLLRGHEDGVGAEPVDQPPISERVASQEHAAAVEIEDRQGEGAEEALEAGLAPAPVGGQDEARRRSRREGRRLAGPRERPGQLAAVVQPAVEDEVDPPGRVGQRLALPHLLRGDPEVPAAERAATEQPDLPAVGAAACHRREHSLHVGAGHGAAVAAEDERYACHRSLSVWKAPPVA